MSRRPGRRRTSFLWIALLLLSTGCTAEPMRRITGAPLAPAPWRIAVLPGQLNEKTRQEAAGRIGEKMGKRRQALEEIRSCLALHIPEGSYEVIALPVVDRDFPPGTVVSAEPEAIRAAARALHADLVLVPEMYSWRRRYYLLHVESRVGITARMYDGATGKLLMESMHERARNQGLLKIPAGPAAAVLAPLVGLQHIYMSDMCQSSSDGISGDLKAFETSTAGGPSPAAPGSPPP